MTYRLNPRRRPARGSDVRPAWRVHVASALLLVGGSAGCSSSDGGAPAEPPPAPPPPPLTVAAAIDTLVPATGVGTPFRLSGLRSTPAGVSFDWRLVAAPGGGHLLSGLSAPELEVTPRAVGSYVVELEVAFVDARASARVEVIVACAPAETPDAPSAGGALRLVNRADDNCPDYRFPDGLEVPAGATLTAEAGVQIEMGAGTALVVRGGRLFLLGDATLGPVTLASPNGDRGAWQGLRLMDSPEAQLLHVTLRDAGATDRAVIEVQGRTRIDLRGLRFENSLGTGIALSDDAELGQYGNNVFSPELSAAVDVPISVLPELRTGTDIHAGDGPYRVRGHQLFRPATIRGASVPYRFEGTPGQPAVALSRDLRIEGGAVVEIADGLLFEFSRGDFALAGTADAPVELGPFSSAWRGILASVGADVTMTYAGIRRAGMTGQPAQPSVPVASLTVTTTTVAETTRLRLMDVAITGAADLALWFEDGADVRCDRLATSSPVSPTCAPP